MKIGIGGENVELAIDALNTDFSYQRPLDPRYVRYIAENLDPARFGIVHVSQRSDGSYWIVDGNHRVHALRSLGEKWLDTKVPCRLYKGLSVAQEADRFVGLNGFHAVRIFSVFKGKLVSRDAEALTISRIVEGVGYQFAPNPKYGIACIGALYRVLRGHGGKKAVPSEERMERVLRIVSKAYEGDEWTPSGIVIEGLGLVIERHGEWVDDARMVQKLSKRPGGHAKLHADARALARVEGGTVVFAAADLIINAYNLGAKSTILGGVRSTLVRERRERPRGKKSKG